MNESSQFLLYTAPDGAVKVDVFFFGRPRTRWRVRPVTTWPAFARTPAAGPPPIRIPDRSSRMRLNSAHGSPVTNYRNCPSFARMRRPTTQRSDALAYSQQNQELAALRDWLLPMLMNGQVRISA